MPQALLSSHILPADAERATLLGRAWSDAAGGPCVVTVRKGQLVDLTHHAATVSELLERDDAATLVRSAEGPVLGSLDDALDPAKPALRLLAPCDLQAVKACGVTFAVSLLERVIEEQAGGDPARAASVRQGLQASLGSDLSQLKPGSEAALRLKAELQARKAWSQYLEVGIGTDAEVFTKSQPMSSVACGDEVGLAAGSSWNNPEPEVVLAVDSRARVRGAALGNDVNLRDIEGRSALLLGKAKDNNASCAIGPFIRLFDEAFSIDSVRGTSVRLRIEGESDGFVLDGVSHMREISRDPLDLVAQTCGRHHQYPDGFMLFLGTMFSPIQDRLQPGGGFTHVGGDRVTISAPELGALVNTVRLSTEAPPWTFGTRALMQNLAARGLLK